MLFHLGAMQWLIMKIGWVLKVTYYSITHYCQSPQRNNIITNEINRWRWVQHLANLWQHQPTYSLVRPKHHSWSGPSWARWHRQNCIQSWRGVLQQSLVRPEDLFNQYDVVCPKGDYINIYRLSACRIHQLRCTCGTAFNGQCHVGTGRSSLCQASTSRYFSY